MSINNLSNDVLNEKFENFLFNMDDYTEALISKAKQQGFDLDFSLNSLKVVENYIVKNDTKVDSNDYNDIAAYVGEVARKNFGGKWICNLDKENNSLYFGFPVIEGHALKDVLFSPFHIVKAFILRRKENTLKTAIEDQVNPKKIDWNNHPSED